MTQKTLNFHLYDTFTLNHRGILVLLLLKTFFFFFLLLSSLREDYTHLQKPTKQNKQIPSLNKVTQKKASHRSQATVSSSSKPLQIANCNIFLSHSANASFDFSRSSLTKAYNERDQAFLRRKPGTWSPQRYYKCSFSGFIKKKARTRSSVKLNWNFYLPAVSAKQSTHYQRQVSIDLKYHKHERLKGSLIRSLNLQEKTAERRYVYLFSIVCSKNLSILHFMSNKRPTKLPRKPNRRRWWQFGLEGK